MSLVTALAPEPLPTVDLSGEALRDWLADRYGLPGDRWLRLNLVTSIGGQITGPGGTSDDLTGGVDRVLLGVLRSGCDAVLVGAASVRVEGYALPRSAQLAVATLSGRLQPEQLPEPEEGRRTLVLCPASEAARLARRLGTRARVLAVPGDVADQPRRLVDALEQHGFGRIVCEGGGALASTLLAARCVDEFDQTIAPIALSPGAPLLSGRVPAATASLAGLLLDGTERLYARWAFQRG